MCFGAAEWLPPQAHNWACQACGHARDMGAVEAQLTCVVRRRVKGYQLQDLRCFKCKQVPPFTSFTTS